METKEPKDKEIRLKKETKNNMETTSNNKDASKKETLLNSKWGGSKKMKILILSLLLLLILGLFTFFAMRPQIQSLSLKKGDLIISIYGTAQLKTDHEFNLKLGTNTKLLSSKVRLGDKVKKGQLLLKFDGASDFYSPNDGVITQLNYRSGETVFAQSILLSIVAPKDLYLEMSLDQKALGKVQEEQEARISFDGFREKMYKGKVRSLYSRDSQFYALIDLNEVNPYFLPGMSADIAVTVETKKDVLLAPLGALKNGQLLLQKEGRRHPTPVSVITGAEDSQFVEILKGEVKVGDKVVLRSSLPKFMNEGGDK